MVPEPSVEPAESVPPPAERGHRKPGHGPVSGGGAGQRLLRSPAGSAALLGSEVDHQEHHEAITDRADRSSGWPRRVA